MIRHALYIVHHVPWHYSAGNFDVKSVEKRKNTFQRQALDEILTSFIVTSQKCWKSIEKIDIEILMLIENLTVHWVAKEEQENTLELGMHVATPDGSGRCRLRVASTQLDRPALEISGPVEQHWNWVILSKLGHFVHNNGCSCNYCVINFINCFTF